MSCICYLLTAKRYSLSLPHLQVLQIITDFQIQQLNDQSRDKRSLNWLEHSTLAVTAYSYFVTESCFICSIYAV